MQTIKSLDYFFVLRPILFFPGWTTMLAGYFISTNKDVYFSQAQILNLDYGTILILSFSFAAAMGATFLLNQFKDIETDKSNEKLFFLANGLLSIPIVKVEATLLILVSILLAISINYSVLLLIVVFILLTGYLYNFPPFALKDHPAGSLIANALMGWLAFMIGALAEYTFSLQLVLASLPYLFFNTALYFFTTLPDINGDREAGKRTLAVGKGFNYVVNLSILSFMVALTFAWFWEDYFALLFLLPSFPFFVLLLAKKRVDNTIKTTKYALLFFTLAICIKIPFYFVVMIGIFGFTKWYFNKRFNYNYPNLKGE